MCPNHAVYILQLLEELRRILGVVLVYYYVCFGLAFCLGDWSAGEDGDLGDGGGDEHLVEDGGADEACGPGEDEMHFAD